MDQTLLLYASIAIFIWLTALSFLYVRLISHYHSLTKGTQKKDIINVMNEVLKKTRDNQNHILSVNQRLDQEIEKAKKHFKRFGFKRFNPFTDTGGDQSFILALLDENNNGFVISSLHSRENTRIYAKSLENGKAIDQVLSKEEQQVINQALKS